MVARVDSNRRGKRNAVGRREQKILQTPRKLDQRRKKHSVQITRTTTTTLTTALVRKSQKRNAADQSDGASIHSKQRSNSNGNGNTKTTNGEDTKGKTTMKNIAMRNDRFLLPHLHPIRSARHLLNYHSKYRLNCNNRWLCKRSQLSLPYNHRSWTIQPPRQMKRLAYNANEATTTTRYSCAVDVRNVFIRFV